jgi:hypothetical protein
MRERTESDWFEFRQSIPRKLVPARRCDCGARVPEEYATWHAEELAQMREAFFDVLKRLEERWDNN